ncbi:MAG: glycosyltransferase [Paracoccus sp. (in: a-proteobacteria)]|nr:glycosyltransferase [Paracoccus sp. (in: a-proteobacteria)]
MPEYAVPLLVAAFPENPRVMLVQTYPWLLRDDWLKRVRTVRLDAVVATSEICAGMTEMAGFGVPLRVPLAIDSAMFHPGDVKKRQISYMPRKRRSEVELVVKALRDRGRVTDFDVVEIDGLPQPQAAEILRESLIFLAFSHAEGFGLPPAEAMAAGCIVIGFTGVGGDEFFSPDISIPISDGNLPAMVRMIEQVVAEYRNDPMRLDAMRHQAAQHIRRNYDDAARRRALFDVFGQIRDKRKVA